MNIPKRYALVGCGGRAYAMFAEPIVKRFSDSAKLVGLCDRNPGRMEVYQKALGQSIPAFSDFKEMVETVNPEVIIVATPDESHHDFIIQALALGLDVISEKPMTTDRLKCKRILDAEKASGKKVTVTFNMRFVPYMVRIRELLSRQIVGDILSVDFHYQLDRNHGADYFRRWHRRKENSGGLLIHKSTHHFDIVNWFLQDRPQKLFASGSLQFYGPKRKERGVNCRTCSHARTCEFYFNIEGNTEHGFSVNNRTLYAEVDHHDGYLRDQCVFDEEINIEDTMHVFVGYAKGTQLSYSLTAHAMYEGWRMAINGTLGRLEAEHWSSGPFARQDGDDIRIHRPGVKMETIHVPSGQGGHGGGDERLQSMLFGSRGEDPLEQMAGSTAGAYSLLIGDAANESMRTASEVRIEI